MYSPELEWLLGGATAVQQRTVLKASARSGCSVPASDALPRASAPESMAVDCHTMLPSPPGVRTAERSRCNPGLYNDVQVIGGLPPRGPREPADTFSPMPCRFL
ncbi:hypothetical protein GH5_04316 [Leishmania sp. Ghana 2012 LV757]|uniref:hypothetical protein n=1 Tax=Leishmania sp. Ghana 2012 LV757 TaxID=2803181 RepID=UPI001B5CA994|nr:hypothetical protein GH5_04316 [Leishmania sp. Ghana 2012 LV757]